MAHELAGKIAPQVVPSLQKNTSQPSPADTDSWVSFPGLQERFPSIEWCVEHEFCCTLEDYLRRRTNISQWIAREGLGSRNENLAHIGILAQHLPAAHGRTPENLVADYVTGVAKRFDQPLAQI